MYLMGAHTCPARVIRLPARTHDALTFAHRKQLFACVFHALLCLKACRKGYRQGIREDRIATTAVYQCSGRNTTSRRQGYTWEHSRRVQEGSTVFKKDPQCSRRIHSVQEGSTVFKKDLQCFKHDSQCSRRIESGQEGFKTICLWTVPSHTRVPSSVRTISGADTPREIVKGLTRKRGAPVKMAKEVEKRSAATDVALGIT